MNLGINKGEANLIYDALNYFLKSTKVPSLLLEMYNNADINCLFRQLDIIKMIGEEE